MSTKQSFEADASWRRFDHFLTTGGTRPPVQRTTFSSVCLANALLKDGESARNSHVLACNFAKYSPIVKKISLADLAINLS